MSTASRLVRLALPLALVASLPACFPSTGLCGVSCGGCCDEKGQCQGGELPNQCGAHGQACGACAGSELCQAGACVPASAACAPVTCAQMGKTCGTISDTCGHTLSCGTCPGGQTCGGGGSANVCGVGGCAAKSCAELGANCGEVSDGCATLLSCGTCTAPDTCGGGGTGNVCGRGCQARSCSDQGKNCGLVSDACGSTLNCGGCTKSGESCGGGGTANVCGKGCTPTTCAAAGKNCGPLDDGCGTTLQCGTCSGWATCGGGGTAGVCGASCPLGCPQGASCDAAGVCQGANVQGLVLDVKTVTFSGRVTLNGGTPTKTCTSAAPGYLILVERTHHSMLQLPIACDATFSFTGQVYPGSYTVSVIGTSYSNLPNGTSFVVSQALDLTHDVSGAVLDVQTVTFAGRVTMNGQTPTKTCTSAAPGYVNLYETTNRYTLQLPIACDATFSFTGQVYPGTYKVSVIGTSYSNLPSGTAFVVSPAMDLSQSVSGAVLDVKTVTFSGRVTLNGQTPTKTCTSAAPGYVNLVETTQSYTLQLPIACDATFSFTGTAYPGTYKVGVIGTSYSNLPSGTSFVVMPALSLQQDVSGAVLDVQTVTFAGRVTLNGQTPTKTCTSAAPGYVSLYETTNKYALQLPIACDATFSFSGQVYPGTYRVSVIGTSYSNLPSGTSFVVSPAMALTQSVSGAVLDVQTVTFAGRVTLNGATPTKTCSSAAPGYVNLSETTLGYVLQLPVACDATFSFSGQVYPGTYKVSVIGTSYSNLPSGTAFVVSPAMALTQSVSGAVLDVKTVTVAGVVTLNGQVPTKTCTSAAPGYVTLVEAAAGYALQIPVACDATFSFTGQIYPGTYKVSVIGTSYSNLPSGTAYVVYDRLAVN